MSGKCIRAGEFSFIGDIHNPTVLNERGQEVLTDAVLYVGVKSKLLPPRKTDNSEVFEENQEVAKEKNSWLIRNNLTRTITANKMTYVVDGEFHEIKGVRRFMSGSNARKYLVLDTELRDNQTN